MATTSNKGFLKHTQASGNAIVNVFSSLLSDLDSLLRGRETESHTLSDNAKAELVSGHRSADLVVTVINEDDHAAAQVYCKGDGDGVAILSQDASHFGTTEGTDASTNIYYDSGNTRYEIENKAGGERTYKVIAEGAE